MSKLVIDVECNEPLENYDTIIYFNGKWTVVNRSSYMAHEVKQRLALQQRFEDLEVELKKANEKILTLAKIIKVDYL